VTAGFAAAFGHEPDGVWAAPGRLNLIGEFTDYNEGFVLPIALGFVTRAAVRRREDRVVRVTSSASTAAAEPHVSSTLDALDPRRRGFWADYVFGILWAFQEAGATLSGLDISLDGDVPIGAGLSSSAALECAVGLAVRDLFVPALDRRAIATLARRAENEFVGVPSGIMDQAASLLCRAGHALLLDTRSVEVEQLPLDLHFAGLELLVLDTGVRHENVTSAYAERREACEAAARALGVAALRDATAEDLVRLPEGVLRRRARHVVTENARVLETARLLRRGALAEVGPLLSEAHRSVRDDFEASSPEVDLAVDAAIRAGALGARMTGGGFGGSVVALVRAGASDAVAAAVGLAFAASSFAPPRAFLAYPAVGAQRLV
jgi:galactokinase